MTVGFFLNGDPNGTAYRLAALLVASIRAAMPAVPVVQFTDEKSAALAGVDEIRRRPLERMGVTRIAHQASVDGDWLFLDADTIVLQDVRDVFDDPKFDVAIASRRGTFKNADEEQSAFMARMPFNNGVVFSRSARFWRAVEAALREMKPERQEFMGEQQALNDVIRSGPYAVRVLAGVYNYPPHSPVEDLSFAKIVHYKGKRKSWILERAARG